MATDRELFTKGLVNVVGMSSAISNIAEAAASGERRTRHLTKFTADVIAADATTNSVCAGNGTASFGARFSVFRKSKLVAARLIPMANTAVTEHASNYATINVTKDNGAGGSQTVVLSNTTKPTANSGLGNIPTMAAGTLVSLTSSIVANAAECDSGSFFQLQITKASSGVVLQPFIIEMDFEEI